MNQAKRRHIYNLFCKKKDQTCVGAIQLVMLGVAGFALGRQSLLIRRNLSLSLSTTDAYCLLDSALLDAGLPDSGLLDSGLLDAGLLDSGLLLHNSQQQPQCGTL